MKKLNCHSCGKENCFWLNGQYCFKRQNRIMQRLKCAECKTTFYIPLTEFHSEFLKPTEKGKQNPDYKRTGKDSGIIKNHWWEK